jgi:hypothetical protein
MEILTSAFGRIATSPWQNAVEAIGPVLPSAVFLIAEILMGAK